MKSLSESLFDSDLVTKKLTFGDLFELDEYESTKPHEVPLSREFSETRIKKLVKVEGANKDEIIYNGLVKLISDIELNEKPENITKQWLINEIQRTCLNLFQYSLKNKKIYVQPWTNSGHVILDRDKSIFDSVGVIQIFLGSMMRLEFKRK